MTGRLARIALAAFLALPLLAAPARPAPAAAYSKRIIGYFVQWAVYARGYEPADIPADKLTHVNYAFLAVNAATGQLYSIDTYADFQKVFPAKNGLPAQTWDQSAANAAGNFGRLRDVKALHPDLKVLLSVGGWTLSSPFPAVGAYLEAGVPAAKLAMGIPFYGRSWETVPATDHGLFQSGLAGPSQGTDGNWENGVFDYWKVVELAATSGYTAFTDPLSQVPFLYGPNLSSWRTAGGLFVTYESPASLAGKLALIQDRGLGGVMFWELSGDVRDVADSASLLGLMAKAFASGSTSGGARPWQWLLLAPGS